MWDFGRQRVMADQGGQVLWSWKQQRKSGIMATHGVYNLKVSGQQLLGGSGPVIELKSLSPHICVD
jgi:hypothetical protein